MLKKILPFFIFFAFPLLGFSVSENLECKNSNPTPAFLAGAGPYCIFYNGGVPNGPDTVYVCDGDSVQLYVASNNGVIWSTGETVDSIYVNTTGTYTATVTDAAGTIHVDEILVCVVVSQAASIALVCPPCNGIVGFGNTYTWNQFVQPTATFIAYPDCHNYLWSTGATTQSITISSLGNYTVTITDPTGCDTIINGYGGGGSGASTATISVGGCSYYSYYIPISGPNSICPGDTAFLTANTWFGGVWSGPNWYYYYNYGTTLPITQGGTYSYGGSYWGNSPPYCPTSAFGSITVTQLTSPNVNISGDTVLCIGQTGNLNATPGFASYLWSNGATTASITNTTSGTYSVTISNGTCDVTEVINVQSSGPCFGVGPFDIQHSGGITVNSDTVKLCPNDSVILFTNPAVSYLWNTGATTPSIVVYTAPTIGTLYTLIATDLNGVLHIDSIFICPETPDSVYLMPSDTFNIYPDSFYTVTAYPSGNSYLWSNGATTQSITVFCIDTCAYSVSMTYLDPCTSGGGGGGGGQPIITTADVVLTHAAGGTGGGGGSGGGSTYDILYNGGIGMGPDTVKVCDGDSVQLYIAPNNGVIWSTGETTDSIYVSATGIYTVTITDALGVTHVDNITVCVVITQAASIISTSGCYPYYSGPLHVLSYWRSLATL